MHFLDIPEEVIIGSICPKLEYNDVLRMRVVNKQLKGYADDHLKLRVATHEFEINETDRPLDQFMSLGVYATRIDFNVLNHSDKYFVDLQPEIQKFLEKYGDKISHLRARYFQAFTVEGEMEFYGALTNLKHLDVCEIDAEKRICNKMKDGVRVHNSPFPNNFKNLETLKLRLIHWSGYPDMNYQWDFFDFCEKLVYFRHAFYPRAFEDMDDEEPFGNMLSSIRERMLKFPNGPHLKYYDVQTLRDDDNVRNKLPLFRTLVQHGVKLLNMDASRMKMIFDRCFFEDGFGDGEPIVSLRSFNPAVLCMRLPNLEEMTIDSFWIDSPTVEMECELNCNPEWPNLKSLTIVISDGHFERRFMRQMLNCLFKRGEPVRKKLADLTLRLKDQVSTSEIPYPKFDSIIATCPNLTTLSLINYSHPAPNKAYSELWRGLKFLKEIYLSECTTLGNAGFVGKNVNQPVFLGLKCLKKLTLKGLDKMPKITDTFFKLVLRHVKLTHFTIQSDSALVSISQDGINSLLTGPFGASIEKFPFEEWSLAGVGEEEFQLLGSKFRSSHMI